MALRPTADTTIGDLRTRTVPAIPEHLTMAAARTERVKLAQATVLLVVIRSLICPGPDGPGSAD